MDSQREAGLRQIRARRDASPCMGRQDTGSATGLLVLCRLEGKLGNQAGWRRDLAPAARSKNRTSWGDGRVRWSNDVMEQTREGLVCVARQLRIDRLLTLTRKEPHQATASCQSGRTAPCSAQTGSGWGWCPAGMGGRRHTYGANLTFAAGAMRRCEIAGRCTPPSPHARPGGASTKAVLQAGKFAQAPHVVDGPVDLLEANKDVHSVCREEAGGCRVGSARDGAREGLHPAAWQRIGCNRPQQRTLPPSQGGTQCLHSKNVASIILIVLSILHETEQQQAIRSSMEDGRQLVCPTLRTLHR